MQIQRPGRASSVARDHSKAKAHSDGRGSGRHKTPAKVGRSGHTLNRDLYIYIYILHPRSRCLTLEISIASSTAQAGGGCFKDRKPIREESGAWMAERPQYGPKSG